MRRRALFDVLSFPPDRITSEDIERKGDDVYNSAKFAFLFAASTALAIWREAEMIYVTPLAALTMILILCLHNERKQLAIMKTIPLCDDNNPSFSSPGSAIQTPTRLDIFASTSPQASNHEKIASPSFYRASKDSKSTRRIAASAPPIARNHASA